jgi:hypothetical protein
MSRNPGTEVDPSEGSLDDAAGFDETEAGEAEQVDPSEDTQ